MTPKQRSRILELLMRSQVALGDTSEIQSIKEELGIKKGSKNEEKFDEIMLHFLYYDLDY